MGRMDLRYEEWLPAAAALKGIVVAYWRCEGDASNVPSSAILPDGFVELVFNFADPVGLSGPAFTGDQPARVVVGLLSQAVQIEYRGPVNTFGIRFHPAHGPAFFGKPAAVLTNKLTALAQVSNSLDRPLSGLFAARWNPDLDTDRAALDDLLLNQLAASSPADKAICEVVDRLTHSESAPSVAELAHELGISSRQVQRRFLAAVGVPPKQFLRTFRFARLWQTATMSPPETWAAIAADHGYADQAHMVREFRSFGVDPPAHFFTPDWYDVTTSSRAAEPADDSSPDVRSVQYAERKRR
jgi:AraC-like DNA-binding protein